MTSRITLVNFGLICVISIYSVALWAKDKPDKAAKAGVHGHLHSKANFDTNMAKVVDNYLKIHGYLADDTLGDARKFANAIVKDLASSDQKDLKESERDIVNKLSESAGSIASGNDLAKVRKEFHYLSRALAVWIKEAKPKGLDLVYCPMVKGSWVQKTGSVRNPYHGKSMLTCGNVLIKDGV